MYTKKFFALFVSLHCVQLSAMDVENKSDAAVQSSVVEKKVNGVVVQYKPGYTGSKLFAQMSTQEQAEHEQKLTKILEELNNPHRETLGGRIINLLYFKTQPDLGVYYLQFAKPTDWDLICRSVESLPGFEALHDTQEFEKPELGHKDDLFKARLALLDLEMQARKQKQEEMRVRKEKDAQRRAVQLASYKKLAAGQKSVLPKINVEQIQGELITAK